jgi:hypothetical protein
LAAQSYAATQFRCAAFHQSVTGKVRTELNTTLRLEQAGREGRLLVRLDSAVAGRFHLDLWWDSLLVWREADGSRLTPETDGLLGGRYTGVLDRQGEYLPERVPFIPDDVAAIADLTGVPDDLLPPLPPQPLAVGARWSDSNGVVVRRLADSAASGRRFARYHIERRTAHQERRDVGGPKPAQIEDNETETGQLTWDNALGPWRWQRTIVAETRIVADAKRGFRSRLEQRIVLQREITDSAACAVK